jgi:Type IV secretion-system coupling protein DNA-binding domain
MSFEDKDKRITCLGETNFRNHRRRFGIKRADRRHHLYLIGKTGTGKSTLIANFARQDMAHGEGLALFDPHGDLVEKLARSVPDERRSDLIYFNPTDPASVLAFNPLEITPSTSKPLVASGLIAVFKKIWSESWGARMEYILRNVLLALLDLPGCTLLDVPRLLDDAEFRGYVVGSVQNPAVRRFWLREYQKFPANFRAEAISPIQNKIGEFLVNPLLRRVVGQPKSSFDLRQVMDHGKILLVNLAKGKIGEDTAALLGAMLVTKFSLAAMSRADVPEDDRRDFYLYIDEFPSFATSSFTGMLSEMRKYHLNLVLAHQYMAQIDETVRDAILGNAGTVVAFRTGLTDALLLEKEFHPEFAAHDLVNLPNYHIYLKLMIDGVVSKAFSAVTMPLPVANPECRSYA